MTSQSILEQFRQAVWCAAEAGDSQVGEPSGVVFIIVWLAFVGQGQKRDDRDPRFLQLLQAPDHTGLIPALIQIGNQNEDRLCRVGDEWFAIGYRLINVRAAAKLDPKQHVNRIDLTLL